MTDNSHPLELDGQPAEAAPPTLAAPPTAAPPPASPPPAAPGSAWDEVHRIGLSRDRNTAWLGGVCSGIANRLGVDPLLIRAAVVALTLIGGFGVVVYLALWLVLPDLDGRILLREAGAGDATAITLIVVLGLVVVGGMTVGGATNASSWFGGWMLPVVAVGIWFAVRSGRRSSAGPVAPHVPPPGAAYAAPMQTAPTWPQGQPSADHTASSHAGTESASDGTTWAAPHSGAAAHLAQVPPVPPRPATAWPTRPQRRSAPRGTGLLVLGLAVLAYGVGLLIHGPTGFVGPASLLGMLLALTATSLAAVVIGFLGRRGGVATVLTLVMMPLVAMGVAVERSDLADAASDVSWAPRSPGEVRDIGAGTLTIDLGSVDAVTSPSSPEPSPSLSSPSPGPSPLQARVGTGEIVILVPAGTELTLTASVGVGDVSFGTLAQSSPSGGAVGVQTDTSAGGLGVRRSVTLTRPSSDGAPLKRIELEASVGLGTITVKEK